MSYLIVDTNLQLDSSIVNKKVGISQNTFNIKFNQI